MVSTIGVQVLAFKERTSSLAPGSGYYFNFVEPPTFNSGSNLVFSNFMEPP